jgi:hypothetical protein
VISHFVFGEKMLNLQASDQDSIATSDHAHDATRALPGGWWIIPSTVLGLAGWVGIFYRIGLL